MKTVILIISMSLVTVVLHSQSSYNGSHEVITSISYLHLKSTFRVESEIGYNYHWLNHGIGVSAILTHFTNNAETIPDILKLSGLSGNYFHNFATTVSGLDLELISGVSYRLFSNTWASNYYSDKDVYIPVNTSSLEHLLDFHLGYGLRFRLGKHLFIAQSIQGGIFKSILVAGRNQYDDSAFIESPEHDFRRYGNKGWMLKGDIRIGWMF